MVSVQIYKDEGVLYFPGVNPREVSFGTKLTFEEFTLGENRARPSLCAETRRV